MAGGGVIGVEINGVPLVIARSEGEVYALDEYCTHEEVSLADGEVYDYTVECWLHGSCFDLRSGKPTGPPASKPLAPGSCVHLPPGRPHCLENTGAATLRVLGVFHPGGSPAAKVTAPPDPA